MLLLNYRRRRNRYQRRQGPRQCTNGKDIPENGEHGPSRPLIFCDDINGPMKSPLTTPVEKVQKHVRAGALLPVSLVALIYLTRVL